MQFGLLVGTGLARPACTMGRVINAFHSDNSTASPIRWAETGLAVPIQRSLYRSHGKQVFECAGHVVDPHFAEWCEIDHIWFSFRLHGNTDSLFSVAAAQPPLPNSEATNVLCKSGESIREKNLSASAFYTSFSRQKQKLMREGIYEQPVLQVRSQRPQLAVITRAHFNQILTGKKFYGTRHASVLPKIVLHRHEQISYGSEMHARVRALSP